MTDRLWRLFFGLLTRRARAPRRIRLAAALALAAGSLVLFATPSSGAAGPLATAGGPPTTSLNAPSKSPEPPGAGNLVQRFPTSPALVNEGTTLYENGCASCHGTLLQGMPGIAPSLVGVGAGPAYFYLSSGRMPLQAPRDEPERSKPVYKPQQIDAIVAFITKAGGGPPSPNADPAVGSLALGFHEFDLHCAGCHQIVARGGMTVGAYVPNLQSASALQIAEAVRMGPYLMPHFDATQINQHQLDSIARYILWTRHPDNAGGWGIYNIGPIPEGMVAWFLALAAMLIVARLIGERVA
jgi:ubiquinol-cytochrome c reductase cytochrome c subunit